jgi:Tfp pilus assembly PilM family ATPase
MTRGLPLGLDIGTARTCVALAERGPDGRPRLVAAASSPTGEDPAAAIRAARAELGTRERRCVLALRAPDSLVRAIVLPQVGRGERERAAAFEAARFAPHALDDGVVRLFALDGGEHAVAVARRTALDRALAIVHAADLRAVAVDDAAFAVLRVHAADAIIDVGASATTIVVRGATLPFVRSVPLGGERLTDAIVGALGVDRASAEQRKRSLGMAGAGEPARDALIDHVAGAFVEARSSGAHDPRAVVLTGNGARLAGLAPAVQRALAVPARLATFGADSCTTLPIDVVRAAAPDWGLAYGLALWECTA